MQPIVAGVRYPNVHRHLAFAAAALMMCALAYSILRIPVQLTDSLVPMLQVQARDSAVDVFAGGFGGDDYLRPMFWTQVKLLFDAAAGERYFAVFKGFHIALVVALLCLFVRAARVSSRVDAAAFALALLVLTGLHTFRGSVWEAFPVNHYLEIAVFCLAALVLSQSGGGWAYDALAAVLFTAAALTLESGLIVWVVLVAARIVGMRGVSGKGLAVVTILLAGYFFLRFFWLQTGSPGLDERATGFGFGRLERTELVARFGEAPYVLYVYNIAASFLSVLLSEPRSGTFELTAQWLAGQRPPSALVAGLSAMAATGLVTWFAIARWRSWLTRRFEHSDQLVLVFFAVAAANSVVSFAYAKDDILSAAGVFYALAVYAATRVAVVRFASRRRPVFVTVLFGLLLLATSTAWAIRATGLHYHMYNMAFYVRNEWVSVEPWLAQQQIQTVTPEGARVIDTLRGSAIGGPVINPHFLPRWAHKWFR